MVRALTSSKSTLTCTGSVARTFSSSQSTRGLPKMTEFYFTIAIDRVFSSSLCSCSQTVMLLSLILADKEQQQEKQRQQEGGQNRTDESTTAGAAAAATGGNDEDLIQFSVVKEGGGDNPTAPTKRVLGNTQREQQEPASPEGQPDTSDAHEAEGKSRGSRSGRGGRRKRHAPTPTLASSDHEALSAKRRRTRSRAVAATGTSEQCFHDEQYAGAGVECHGSAGDDAILLVSEASSSRGEGSGLDESDGSSDGSKSDYVPMSAGSEVCVCAVCFPLTMMALEP